MIDQRRIILAALFYLIIRIYRQFSPSIHLYHFLEIMEMIPVPFTDLDIHHTRLNQWLNTIFIQRKSVLYHRLQISFETVHVREENISTNTHKIMRKKMW